MAREVGVEGKLGGQASVPGAAGTWKDLTDNVNQLAANLTTQVRAIAEVATAVTKGDLTRSITVDAQGEVAALKDNINEMIRNLKDTTQKNSEQDWLKTNLAKFSRMLQGQKDLLTVGRLILSELAPVVVGAARRLLHPRHAAARSRSCKLLASYAYRERKSVGNSFKLGEGLVGQCALEKEKILLTNVPADYIRISSGLGEAPPLNVIVLPVVFEGAGQGGDRARLVRALQHRPTRPSSISSPRRSASCSTRSKRTCAPRTCSSSRSRSPASCRASRKSCSRPTRSWRRRPGCSPSRTPRSSARTARSSRPARRSKRRRSSSR